MRSTTVARVELYGLADIARELGVSVQAIKNRHDRGTLPDPDHHHGQHRRPLWTRSTLEEKGILEPNPDHPSER